MLHICFFLFGETSSFWIRQYPYKSHIFCVIDLLGRIYPVREIYDDFPVKEGTVRVLLPFSRNRPESHSHNLGNALGEVLGLLCAPFTSLFLSPLYPFHLSLSLFLFLSYLSLPIYISPSTFLSLSLLLSVFSLSFSMAYLMDVFVLVSFLFSSK